VIRAAIITGFSATTEYVAEAGFLRGFYHFEGKKLGNFMLMNFSYVNGNLNVPIMILQPANHLSGQF
jgi:hypothetical protein